MSGLHTGLRVSILALMIILPLFNTAQSQKIAPTDPNEEYSPMPDLVPIEFQLKSFGRMEMISYQRGNNVYLPVQTVFDFLRIKNKYDQTEGVVSGFFVTPDTPYAIDAKGLRARVGNRTRALVPDELTMRGDTVFLRVDMYNQLFGLPVTYRARSLAASLATQMALPVFLDARIKRLEDEFRARPGVLKPEATADRTFALINGGRLDYSLQQSVSSTFTPLRNFNTRMTGMVLGGDVEARIIGDLSEGVDVTQARAFWRYVPTGPFVFKQAIAGDFTTTGLLSSEIYGVELTNHPASPRIYYSEQTFRGPARTDRGVYLFQNSRLAAIRHDTTTAYKLDANLRYGVNYVDVKEYGYWGETFTSTYRVVVPATLVPPGELDYDVSVGRLRQLHDPWYGSLSSQWGVSSRVTAGMRTEFYDIKSLPTKIYPNFNLTTRLTNELLGDLQLSPNALWRGSLDLTLPSLAGASLSYTAFRPIRLFNPRLQINELILRGFYPFSLNGERFALDLTASQSVLVPSRERHLTAGFSAFVGAVSPSVTTEYGWLHVYGEDYTSLVFHETRPALRLRLPANLFLSLAAPYDHIKGEFRNLQFSAVLQPVANFMLQFGMVKLFDNGASTYGLTLQYMLPFSRVTASAIRGSNATTYTQSISGSVGAVPELGEVFFDNTPSRAGFGGIVFAPFLDMNMNGTRDPGEPILNSARIKATTVTEGGFQLNQIPNVGWVIPRAIPYQDYIVELEQRNLDNPLWIPRYHIVKANAAPGSYTYVGVPVVIGGAVRGTVAVLKGPQLLVGVENLRIRIKEDISDEELARLQRTRVEKTVETFSNGDYEAIGLPPGKYIVSLDAIQVSTMGFQDRRASRDVKIEPKPDGDIVEGVNFVLVERK